MNDRDLNDTETIEPKLNSSRRKFLVSSGGIAAAAAVLVACSDDDESSTDTTAPGDSSSADSSSADSSSDAGGGGDLAVAEVAAGLELLAVTAYTMVGEKATSGGLGEVPPAVVEFVTVVGAQHQEALDLWNGALTGAGMPEVTEPAFPPDSEITVDQAVEALNSAADLPTVANLALFLEQTAVKTYFGAVPMLTDPANAEAAAGLEAVDQQHAAVLLFVLGEYPVPDTFVTELMPTPPS